MVIRQWRGLARKERAADYLAHVREEVLPALRKLSGFRGVEVLRRESDEGVEITVLTRWDSLAAIRAFAGKDLEVAVVARAAQPLFHSYDLRVTHHDVAFDQNG
jgi:heme-degrading monooxygenase HmoA